MGGFGDILGLSESAFYLLRDLIHERTGLYYDDGKRELLSDKLAPLVVERGLRSFLDYYYLLRYDASADEEWSRVMDALAVPETYFWREVEQIQALVEVIVPEHYARAGHVPLRIWSAACASGEEPLSIAIALQEAGWFDRLSIEIYATDGSRAAIQRARRGIYREWSFRKLPQALRDRYFEEITPNSRPGVTRQWRVDPSLLARIRWDVVNLMDPSAVARYARADVVFCRNVFIYFSEEATTRVVNLFYQHMRTPGYLFVGASESLLRLRQPFTLQEVGSALAYVKEARTIAQNAPSPATGEWVYGTRHSSPGRR